MYYILQNKLLALYFEQLISSLVLQSQDTSFPNIIEHVPLRFIYQSSDILVVRSSSHQTH